MFNYTTYVTDGQGGTSATVMRPLPVAPVHRPVEEIRGELEAQRKIAAHLESHTVPEVRKARDRAGEALNVAQGKLAAVAERLERAVAEEQQRQREAGYSAIQWGFLTPTGSSAAIGVTPLERLLIEKQTVEERDVRPALVQYNKLDRALSEVRSRTVFMAHQRVGQLEEELRRAEAAAAAAPADPADDPRGWRKQLGAMAEAIGLALPAPPAEGAGEKK